MAQRKKARRARRRKVEAGSKGLEPADVRAQRPADGEKLARLIERDGGAPLTVYREPLGGRTVVLAALPIGKVEPTPYQRDLSEMHVKRLANAMERLGRYLDPLIAVRHEGRYWTPNGNHRLAASKLLGAKSIVALVMPEEEVAFQILALNTEKAHNLKERSLEVIRMYRGLVGARGKEHETELAGLFEEPAFATFGAAYEKRPRFSASAYSSLVKKLEGFQELPLKDALKVREARADKLLRFDDAVVQVVAALKERGFQSPYLKNFVVARVNFLRFVKGDKVPEFDHALDKMIARTPKLDPSSVKKEDLASMGGPPAEPDEE
jgi:ParB family transcriptional regulator, chromosome partitioning protein